MLYRVLDELAHNIEDCIDLTYEEILDSFEKPKKREHGHLALPVFRLAKKMRKAPPQIAQEVADKITEQNIPAILSVSPLSGFINFYFKTEYLQKQLSEFLSEKKLGFSTTGQGKKLIIDYSSPNVAKPMHVGHLRATVIGQALRNLAETQGYEVIGLNHLGDWGVQFGKLAWAYQKWGEEYDFENDAFESLFALYVRFHKEVKQHPEYEKEGAAAFKKLEEGDVELKSLWEKFIAISMEEYNKSWNRLGVKHDLVRGESFYSDRLDHVVNLLKDKSLLEESDGAEVVFLGKDEPPCLIRKSDGASLYATRDLASALYRMEELNCDLNVYVTGVEQKLHFKQIFGVLDKMGYEWSKDCHHITFGMYRFKKLKEGQSKKMSSREGEVIRLEDVLNETREHLVNKITEINPGLKNKDEVCEKVAVGAVVFNDLLNDRVKDVEFDWDKITDFTGDSGPYVQYSVVRCRSILEKAKTQFDLTVDQIKFEADLIEPQEVQLMVSLLDYQSVLKLSFETFKPNYLASYLLEVARSFSSFYSHCSVLNAKSPELRMSRLSLVFATIQVLECGLQVLNIDSPKEM